MTAAINPYFILLPLVLGQYIYATFALVRLARAHLSTPKYVLWNLFILLAFYIGATVFLIYDAATKKRREEREAEQAKVQAGKKEPPIEEDTEKEIEAHDAPEE